MPEDPTNDLTNDPDAHTTPSVEVRRNLVLSASVGAVAGLLAAAFAVRAFGGGDLLDWAGFTVLGVIALVYLAAVVDSRAPLLIADDQGVRLREGSTWLGVAWTDIECLEHLPRHGLLKDGHLLVVGDDDQQLVVPLTLATRVVGAAPGMLSDTLADLADGRADVVEVVPGLDEPADQLTEADPDPEETIPVVRRGIAAEVDRHYHGDAHPGDPGSDAIATGEMAAVRSTVVPARFDVRVEPRPQAHLDSHLDTHGANALRLDALPDPEAVPDEVTVVLTDVSVQPADEPVVGPQLAEARERLRLSVEQLSERTRIRPHVIESIEVDDFAPCGGDFYARGHLRTLGRVLGVDSAPLVATYDEKYADAPVDPRRVFASELATGVGGSIRGTRGGRNWSVLIAAVMAAILVWSIAKLAMDGPVQLDHPPVLNQSGGLPKAGAGKADPVGVTLTAVKGGAQLVVRDASGDVVFDGNLAFGQTSDLKVVPPVRVWTSDGSVTASVDGQEAEPLGDTGSEASTTLVAPSD
ncbi:helix-turn-helix domain-containing protein [Nocardioides panacisoli]|uniref:Cytoskeleton protein RodZ-like C-terminal domain-containing protein n=1 Tax=Nocardioides panacisoli TaxID=627624 RepID=A0ABP7I4L4_9ACTN